MMQYRKILYIKAFLIAMMLFSVFAVKAQYTPGGTNYTVEFWLDADDLNGANNDNVSIWTDKNGRYSFQTNASIAPRLAYDGLNYHAGVRKIGGTTEENRVKLVSSQTFSRTRSKAYYIFYVSKRLRTGNFTDPAVLFSLAGTSDYVGWSTQSANQLVSKVYSPSSYMTHPGGGRSYGIGIYTIPNVTSGTRRLYHNGVQMNSSGGLTGTASSNPVLFSSSTSATSAANYFTGDIYELIVLSASAGIEISNTELQKVQSYLAIKYGQTLSGQNDLYNSAGTMVWSSNRNRGYSSNIFGLARDSKTRLYQKQAANTENSDFVIFQGNLANLNKNNTSDELADGDYILLGNNGLQGIVGFGVLADTPFRNGKSFDFNISYRHKQTYRVQMTGSTAQKVNFKLPAGRTIMLVSSSYLFNLADTDAYEADNNGEVRDVTLTGNEYISFVMLTSGTPVNYNAEVWLRSNEGIGLTSGAVSAWNSVGGATANYTGASGRRPVNNTTGLLMNYRPSVKFSDNSHYLSGPNLNLDAGKSYYTFSVSKLDKLGSGTYYTEGSVFFTLNYNNLNYDMYSKSSVPSFTTASRNVISYTQAAGKKYGIIGTIRPNTDTDKQMIYFNGNFEEKDAGVIQIGGGSGSTSAIGGSSIVSGYNYNAFLGEVQEVLVLSTTNKGQIDMIEAFKINSYLAFKYGLTIDTDYISATGTLFWAENRAVDNSGTIYNKSIFGIGRGQLGHGGTNAINFNQNMARPYHGDYSGPFTVYVGTWNALNDGNNATVLPDETYLMFSSNANIRTMRPKEVAIPENTPFKNGQTNDFEINYSSAVYKVQLTSPTATSLPVKLRTHVSQYDNSYLLVSTDPNFNPTQTDLISFNSSNEIESLELTDGLYIAIAGKEQHAPGGVAESLKMWLRADVSNTLDLVNTKQVDTWRDYSTAGITYSYLNLNGTHERPTREVSTERLNYHPAVIFTPVNNNSNNPTSIQYLSSTDPVMSTNAPSTYTFFTVFYNNFSNYDIGGYTGSYYLGFGATGPGTTEGGISEARRPTFGSAMKSGDTSKGFGRYYESVSTSIGVNADGQEDLFKPRATAIAMVEVHNRDRVRFEYDAYGEEVSNANIGSSGYSSLAGPSMLGVGSRRQRALDGQMGEIFAYERALTEDEKISVYSYLGLKYGITLDNDKEDAFNNYDYTFSNGKELWPGTSSAMHQPFHNNVAALVLDESAGLDNRISHSTGDGAVINMAVVNATNRDDVRISPAESAQAHFVSLEDDKTAVVWGHNGLNGMYTFDPDADNVCGDMEVRYEKIWMVDLIGMDKQEVLIGAGGYGFDQYAFPANDVYLLVSTDLSSFQNQQWDEAVPMYWRTDADGQNGMHQAIYTFTEKYTYFTLGIKENEGACDACESDIARYIEFKKGSSANQWANGQTLGSFSLGDLNANLSFTFPKVTGTGTARTRFYSGNPRAYNGSTMRITRRNHLYDPLITKLAFTTTATSDPIGAAVEFDVLEIGGYTYNKYEDFVVWGTCDDGQGNVYIARPKVSYYLPAAQSSYTLQEKKDVSVNVSGYSDNMSKLNGGGGAVAKRRPTASWSHNRSKMHVEFTSPVQNVYVQYKAVGSSSRTGIKRFGLSPFTISCPKPLPAQNEDGLVFVKYANPTELLLCQEFQMTYRIINNNCSPKPVDFSELLPSDLKFVEETLSVDYQDALTNATVSFTSDAQGKHLEIKDLMLKAGGETSLRIAVRFEMAATAQTYELANANINYDRLVNGIPSARIDLRGTDHYNGTYITYVKANPATMRPEPVEISNMRTSTSCYVAENEIELTFDLNNTNTMVPNGIEDIGETELEIFYNEEFTFLSVETGTAAIVITDITSTLDPDDQIPGNKLYKFSQIPKGKHSVKIRVKAPNRNGLIQDEETTGFLPDGTPITQAIVDSNGRPVYVPLYVDFEFNLSEPDECGDAMMARTSGSFAIDHCKEISSIFSNKNVTGKIVTGADDE